MVLKLDSKEKVVDVGAARELPLAGIDLDALRTRLALPRTEKDRPQRKANHTSTTYKYKTSTA